MQLRKPEEYLVLFSFIQPCPSLALPWFAPRDDSLDDRGQNGKGDGLGFPRLSKGSGAFCGKVWALGPEVWDLTLKVQEPQGRVF